MSKRTVYDHFGDKDQLFEAVIGEVVEHAVATTAARADRFEAIDDVERDLGDLAVEYARAVLRPEVVRARRLVVREAERFPELARRYYERAPRAAIDAVAVGLHSLDRRELLAVDDPRTAAEQFAYLLLAPLLDQALLVPGEPPSGAAIVRHARRSTAVFVRTHRRRGNGSAQPTTTST